VRFRISAFRVISYSSSVIGSDQRAVLRSLVGGKPRSHAPATSSGHHGDRCGGDQTSTSHDRSAPDMRR
jgi:hypothetical protein